MKKIFNVPEIEIVPLDVEIITTSTLGGIENRDGHNETPDW